MQPHSLTNFAIQKYYQNEPRFNLLYQRDSLPNEIKDGAYLINIDENFDIVTHLVAFYELNNNVTLIVLVQNIFPKESKHLLEMKTLKYLRSQKIFLEYKHPVM